MFVFTLARVTGLDGWKRVSEALSEVLILKDMAEEWYASDDEEIRIEIVCEKMSLSLTSVRTGLINDERHQ